MTEEQANEAIKLLKKLLEGIEQVQTILSADNQNPANKIRKTKSIKLKYKVIKL